MSLFSFKSSVLAPALLFAVGAFASDLQTLTHPDNVIESAVTISVTPKGEKYFETHLETFIANSGFSAKEGFFPDVQFDHPDGIPINKRGSPSDSAITRSLRNIKETLQNWLTGFELADPKPHFQFTNAGYQFEFTRLALVTDRPLLQRLGKNSGAVLAVEIDAHKLAIGADRLDITDPSNSFLGLFAVDQLVLANPESSGQQRLKIRLPFYLAVDREKGFVLEALPSSSNFSDLTLELENGAITSPNVAVEINGRKFEMNKDYLAKTFTEAKHRFLPQILAMLDEYVQQSLPTLLTEQLKTLVPTEPKQVSFLKPAGAPENSKDKDYLLSLAVRELDLKDRLSIEMAGAVEDSLNPNSKSRYRDRARGVPNTSLVPPSEYDLVMTINRGIINRVLQLSFERGYFDELNVGDSSIKLLDVPSVDAIPMPNGEPLARIHLKMEFTPSWYEKAFVENPVELSFDIFALLKPAPIRSKGMIAVLREVDLRSLSFPEKNLTSLGRMFRDTVMGKVTDRLLSLSRDWKKSETRIPSDIPLPPELLGLKLDIHKIKVDPNGHLVMYLNFRGQS